MHDEVEITESPIVTRILKKIDSTPDSKHIKVKAVVSNVDNRVMIYITKCETNSKKLWRQSFRKVLSRLPHNVKLVYAPASARFVRVNSELRIFSLIEIDRFVSIGSSSKDRISKLGKQTKLVFFQINERRKNVNIIEITEDELDYEGSICFLQATYRHLVIMDVNRINTYLELTSSKVFIGGPEVAVEVARLLPGLASYFSPDDYSYLHDKVDRYFRVKAAVGQIKAKKHRFSTLSQVGKENFFSNILMGDLDEYIVAFDDSLKPKLFLEKELNYKQLLPDSFMIMEVNYSIVDFQHNLFSKNVNSFFVPKDKFESFDGNQTHLQKLQDELPVLFILRDKNVIHNTVLATTERDKGIIWSRLSLNQSQKI